MRDLYADLGVPYTATTEEIRHAFRQIAATEHPDRASGRRARGERVDPEVYLYATLAHEVLSDPQKRAEYDLLRTASVRGETIDPQKIKDLIDRTLLDMAPGFSELREAAQSRNWLGVGVSTAKVGFVLWGLSSTVRSLVGKVASATVKQEKKKSSANVKALPKGSRK